VAEKGKQKRRLPVIGSSPAAGDVDGGEQRPPWQWVVIGVIAAIIGWLLLAMLAHWGLGSLTSTQAPSARWVAVVTHAFGFALASFGAGCLVGRFGTATTRRHSAMAGAFAATVGVAMALVTSGGVQSGADVVSWVLILLVLVGLGAGSASFGDRATRHTSRPPEG